MPESNNSTPMKKDYLCLLAALLAGGTTLRGASLTASDAASGDAFGIGVSISGGTGVVGAPFDDIGSNTNQGSAYLFRGLSTATGTVNQNAKLTASDGAANDGFGLRVSISGTTSLIGAYLNDIGGNADQGSAYIFRALDTATGSITQNAKLTASDGAAGDQFGESVSISGTAGLVGAPRDVIGSNINQGSAYIFRGLDTATGSITQNAKLVASDGAASDFFGGLSISLSGNIGLIGAHRHNVGSNADQGAAYVFRGLNTATGTVNQNVKLTASDGAASDFFGGGVSLSGSIGLVGARGDTIGTNASQGAAYVFRSLDTATGTVNQNAKLVASDGAADDIFGNSVSISGNTGLVGARADDIGSNADQGSAYIFRNLDTLTGTNTQSVKLIASDGVAGDLFGVTVSLDGDNFLIGATPIDGSEASSGKAYSGSVSSVTTMNAGSSSRTISGLSFQSADDWIIGQTTDSNSVTLAAGNTATVTNASKAVYIGRNAGSDGNTLVVQGTLNATQITVGAAGNTGNKLLVGQSNRISDTANITLSGGTIERGAGVSETFGNLNLTAASFLDFGAGAGGTLRFGTYAPTSLLTVSNFAFGNTLIFGSNLTASITNPGLFTFDNGFTYAWDSTNAIFTITAIPEPSSVAVAVGLAGLLAAGAGRRRIKSSVD